jgi:hypothetical protein
MLKLRHEAGDSPEHFQVYSGQVRVGTIYRTHQHPGGKEWMWFLNGVQNGPGPFNGPNPGGCEGRVAASWGAWLKAAGLSEDTPTVQLKDSDSAPASSTN